MYISYKFGKNKYWDSVFIIMMALYIIAMQYRLMWDGYGKMVYSYHKYISNNDLYSVVDAEVIDTKKHILAGLNGIISCDINYCTLRYHINGISYEVYTEVVPDHLDGEIIKIASYNNNPQMLERITPYPADKYHWGAQIIIIILGALLVKFTLVLKELYRD